MWQDLLGGLDGRWLPRDWLPRSRLHLSIADPHARVWICYTLNVFKKSRWHREINHSAVIWREDACILNFEFSQASAFHSDFYVNPRLPGGFRKVRDDPNQIAPDELGFGHRKLGRFTRAQPLT